MENSSRPRNSLVAIDLLRFAAAMMVMLCHYFGHWALPVNLGVGSGSAVTSLPTNAWLHSGWIGVEIFFVISGYVIALSAAGSSASHFARRRLLRLWPGALVCATITALVLLAAGVSWTNAAPRYATSVSLGLVGDPIDPVYWTLRIECIFYALVTMLLAIGRWDAIKVAMGLSLWSLAYVAWTLALGGSTDPEVYHRSELLLQPYGAFFGMGILIQQAHRDPASVKGWMFLPSCLAAPLLISGFVAADARGLSSEPQLLFVFGVVVIVLSARMQAAARSEQFHRYAVALGLATYPLYLLHQYVGEALLIGAVSLGIPPIAAVGIVILLMVLIAMFIALWVEPLVRTRLDRLLRLRLRPVPEPAG
jgi:peptidoglycan/LPS O-acetylase OafA/YrhL